jgi:thiol-disulfide isomerase/thioredoxin
MRTLLHFHTTLVLLAAAAAPLAGMDEARNFGQHAATVFVFLATDCPIANSMAPELQRLHTDFKDRDVAFYRVYADAQLSEEEIARHGRDYALPFPALHDKALELVAFTGATVTPEAVVYRRDGTRAYRGRINNRYEALGKYRPRATQHDLRDALEAVLDGRDVSTPETEAIGCFLPEPVAAKDAAPPETTTP